MFWDWELWLGIPLALIVAFVIIAGPVAMFVCGILGIVNILKINLAGSISMIVIGASLLIFILFIQNSNLTNRR